MLNKGVKMVKLRLSDFSQQILLRFLNFFSKNVFFLAFWKVFFRWMIFFNLRFKKTVTCLESMTLGFFRKLIFKVNLSGENHRWKSLLKLKHSFTNYTWTIMTSLRDGGSQSLASQEANIGIINSINSLNAKVDII